MIKRPLLCGVVVFVIGELTGLFPYMAMGLGMAGFLFLLWYLWNRRKKKQTMPVLILPLCICFLLGILNGGRCRIPDELQMFMEENEEETYCIVQGKVKRIEYRGNRHILVIQTERMEQEGFICSRSYTIKVYEDGSYDSEPEDEEQPEEWNIHIGNRIQCELKLLQPAVPTNPGEFNGKSYYQARGIDCLGFTNAITVLNEKRNPVLQGLTELQRQAQQVFYQSIPEENAGVMSAMLLGDSGELDSGIRKLYQRNGIAHILAISALHISIIGSTLYQLLRKLGCSYLAAGIPVMIVLVLYGWLTGFSGSTIRAVIMFILTLGGDILERTYDMLTAIGIACLWILVENPYRLWDAGFLLSFSAVLTLGIVVPVLQEYMESFRNKRVRWYLANSVLSGVTLQIMTGPIVVYFYYDFPIYGVVLNLIVIPLMTPVVVCGFLGLMVYPLFPWMGTVIILPCDWILNLFRCLCEATEELPGAILHVGSISIWEIGIYYSVLLTVFLLFKYRKKVPCFLIGLLYICFVLLQNDNSFIITMLDIGQGDCILLETPNHQHILMDGGSSSRSSIGEYIITPAVKYYGSGCLDYVFVSHMDQDHVNGVQELIALSENGGIGIRYLILPELAETEEDFQELMTQAEQAGIQIETVKSGDVLLIDQVSFACLYPDGISDESGQNHQSIRNSKNDNSMVVSVSYGDFDMLFTGDLEAGGERRLLEEHSLLSGNSYDVLKVGHHGSSGSSSMEFLNRIQPDFSLISCGRNNSYGHPHVETIERLETIESQIYCTVDKGAIEIRTDGRTMEFHFFNAEESGL